MKLGNQGERRENNFSLNFKLLEPYEIGKSR